jgi:hypothetical protein
MYMRTYARMRCIYMVFVRQAPSACAWCVSMSKSTVNQVLTMQSYNDMKTIIPYIGGIIGPI